MDDFLPKDVVDAEIQRLVEVEVAIQGAAETGACSEIEDRLTDFLQQQRFSVDWRQMARLALTRYRTARRHRRQKGQPRLFDPEALYRLSLTETAVVPEKDATRGQVIRALRVRTQAHLHEQEDYTEDIAYLSSRIEAFQTETERQIDVEIRDFGWQPDNGEE